MNQFEIGYMINPTLQVNKVFKYQSGKCLIDTFHHNTMEGINKFRIKSITVLLH